MNGVLITGGTGSLGHELVNQLLALPDGPTRIAIYSRDEQKQEAMRQHFGDHPALRFFLGDVRDADRLTMALRGIDTVIHAAALKIVPKCEYDPEEAVKTNINGTMNVIDACIGAGVQRAILVSTDKAVNPVNLYGSTKLTAEKLFVAANNLSGSPGGAPMACRFSVVRYGNVVNSRGSVIPFWQSLAGRGLPLPITDLSMTRFWITLDQAGDLVLSVLGTMKGGEIFVPDLPAFRLADLAEAIAPLAGDGINPINHMITGVRPGEKIHECLVSPDEMYIAGIDGDMFVIPPPWRLPTKRGEGPSPGFYSNKPDKMFTVKELREMLAT